MVTTDSTVGQVYGGEACMLYLGSRGETLREYSAWISGFRRTGFKAQYTSDRTMGTYVESREGITDGEVSFDVIITGSLFPELGPMTGSTPLTGYRQYVLAENNKYYKIKLEFRDSSTGLIGSPILTADRAYKQVYYNARSVSLETDVMADSYLKGTLSFKVRPFNDLGSSNYRELDKDAGIALGSWGLIETEWDTDLSWS